MDEITRARSKQFSEVEKEVLLTLVNKDLKTIESKESKARNITKKAKAWEDITEEFNRREEVSQRTKEQLKKC